MNALILEASTEKGIVILANNGIPIDFQHLEGGPALSKSLALEVKNLIDRHNFNPAAIAVGIGPGSYTGIRVAAALAQTLGFAWNIPVYGFCSLKAFLPSLCSSWTVAIDARMGGIYILKDNKEHAFLCPISEALNHLKDRPRIASPHPETIRKRVPALEQLIETTPNPKILSEHAFSLVCEGNLPGISLVYPTSP